MIESFSPKIILGIDCGNSSKALLAAFEKEKKLNKKVLTIFILYNNKLFY